MSFAVSKVQALGVVFPYNVDLQGGCEDLKRRIFSFALAVCLCISVIPAVYAEGNIPTPQVVYETLIALKDQGDYCEGTPWDDSNHSYSWNGGPVAGNITGGTGCAAFAFELSDKAFGTLPARTLTTGSFQLSDVRAGDILRVQNNSHSVIVLQVTDGGAVIAEANYHVNGGAGTVHWGRAISREEVEAANYFITRYPEGYMPPNDPTAGQEIDSGSLGNLTWKLTKAGTLTISGSGAMSDFSEPSETPWNAYTDKILTIILENGVTNVGSRAFYGSKALSVTIPGSVTTIGSDAFYGSALVSVNIPGSVRTIGDNAFRSCANLVSVNISEGLETIGSGAFRACAKLPSITLPASIRSVGDSAFLECSEMTEANFKPSTANEPVIMNNYMFARCWKLNKVTLPQKVDCIADYMFLNCLFLTSLNIPQGATRIGESAFSSCPLSSIYIPDSVVEIGMSAFPVPRTLNDVYFGGSEADWSGIQKVPTVTAALEGATIHYNKEPPETPSTPDKHEHSWASDWSRDSDYHWHECLAQNCGITGNSGKSGYGAHSYGGWVIDQDATASQSGSRHRICSVCGYSQTGSIPATGGSSSSGGNSSSDYTPPSTTTTTTRNPDGSVTVTKTDRRTGTITETTQNPDGSRTVVETKKDGTVTTRKIDKAGNKAETIAKPDGSSTVIVEQKDGTTATVTTSAASRVEAEVKLSASAVSSAQQSGTAVTLPIPQMQAAPNTDGAPTVVVNTGSERLVKVEIPAVAPTPGTVVVVVHADGRQEVIKSSCPTANGVTASLPDGATVKIVDNRRDFVDVSPQYCGADAIAFVSARELFAGTSADTFTPDAPMTRAMLVTVLARFDGADISGGTTWYEKGVEWAIANGVSDGSSPERNITREQLVTMLWRYAGSPAATGNMFSFADEDQISGYARKAMQWAVENGIVSGFGNGRLGPQGQATRVQVAQMLKSLIEK